MYEQNFSERLTQLRKIKGVSARDMSLSLGQNPGYIHNIESGKGYPSMICFFRICEYLDVTPKEFFSEYDNKAKKQMFELTQYLKQLDDDCVQALDTIVRKLSL